MISFNFIWEIFNNLLQFGNTLWDLLNTEIFGAKLYLLLGVASVGVLVISITIKLIGLFD